MYTFKTFFHGKCWWGKIFGAIFGYMVARAAGAIIGLLIGNFFDRALCQQFARPFAPFFNEKDRGIQHLFLEATFTVLGYIAKSDGRVSEQEIQAARTLMDSMKLNKKQRKVAQEYFNQGKSNIPSIENLLNLLQTACKKNPSLLHTFVNIQYAMAQVDGLSDQKITALNKILIRLGLAPLNKQHRFYEDFDYRTSQRGGSRQSSSDKAYRQQNPFKPTWNSLDEAHGILGTKPADDEQTIKKAYRRLISQNHPDKLIAKGASEVAIKNANNKTQAIRKAYEQICASKGF